jgi:hypothetical protein
MALLARVDGLEHRAGRGRAAAEERERWVRGWNRARAILRQGGRTEAQRRRALRVLGLIEDDATERRYWRDRELVARWDALTGRVPDLHLMGPPRPVLSPADALEVIAAEQFKGSAVAAKKALQRAADNVNDQAAIAGLPRL